MKKSILSFLAIVMVVSLSNTVMAQTTATVTTATATANIIAPITITHAGVGLAFGNVIKGAGTVTVAPNGNRTGTAELLPATQVGTVTAAVFTVGGEGNYSFSIDLPENGEILTAETGATTMAVDNFTSNGIIGTGDDTAALVNGEFTLNVGATLTVGDTQASGEYTITFPVTVAYN